MKRGLIVTLSLIFISSLAIVQAASLKVSSEHPFLVNNQWIPAKELNVGDNIMTSDGKIVRINKITWHPETVDVYNLEASEFSDFIVSEDDLIVHNSNAQKMTSTKLTEKIDGGDAKLSNELADNLGAKFKEVGSVPLEAITPAQEASSSASNAILSGVVRMSPGWSDRILSWMSPYLRATLSKVKTFVQGSEMVYPYCGFLPKNKLTGLSVIEKRILSAKLPSSVRNRFILEGQETYRNAARIIQAKESVSIKANAAGEGLNPLYVARQLQKDFPGAKITLEITDLSPESIARVKKLAEVLGVKNVNAHVENIFKPSSEAKFDIQTFVGIDEYLSDGQITDLYNNIVYPRMNSQGIIIYNSFNPKGGRCDPVFLPLELSGKEFYPRKVTDISYLTDKFNLVRDNKDPIGIYDMGVLEVKPNN
jgi:hypothetical protein